MSAIENAQGEKIEGQEKVEETGIGAFRRTKPSATAAMHKDLQSTSISENVAHFQSLLNAKAMAMPSVNDIGAEPRPVETGSKSGGEEKAGKTPYSARPLGEASASPKENGRSKKIGKTQQTESDEAKREFPNDGRGYNFPWPKAIQDKIERLQYDLKLEGDRITIRDFIILGLVSVLDTPKDQIRKKINEALKVYGV